ncbi:hypothetical protein BJX99DRAFT_86642 [Aspergillus californicus]
MDPIIPEPILTRAWTLQKTYMSPRLLIFGNESVSWECRECLITYKGAQFGEISPSLLSLCSSFPLHRNEDKSDDIYRFWDQARMKYSTRSLTCAKDKLNAIGAVASKIARTTRWTYMAGLWKEHLADELLWAYTDPDNLEPDPEDYPFFKTATARSAARVAPSSTELGKRCWWVYLPHSYACPASDFWIRASGLSNRTWRKGTIWIS